MDSLDVVFRLLDRVSPTLGVMDRHLASTKQSMGAVDKALRDLDVAQKRASFTNERDPMKRYRLGLELMRDQMSGAKTDAAGASGSIAMLGGAAGVAAGIAFAVASAFAAVARSAVGAAVEVTKFGIEAASFKRDTLTALELIEGDGKVAEDTFSRLSELADKTPFKTSDVLTFGKTLRSTGFTIRETEDLLAGMFDVGAVQGKEGPEKVRQLLEGITKIKGRDALNMESLESVLTAGAGAGVNMKTLTEAIARGRKVSVDQAKALLSSGQIRGTEGLNAILDTIQKATDKGGPLGKATLEFGRKSLDGQLSTFSSRLESIFYGVDVQPLVNVMQRINDLLSKDSPTSRRIREFASETLGGMFKWAESRLTSENIERALQWIVNAAEKTGKAFEAAKPLIGAFAEGFGESFDKIPGTVDPVTDALDGLNAALGSESTEVWKEFGKAIGEVVKLVGLLGKAILWFDANALPVLHTLGGLSLAVATKDYAGAARILSAEMGRPTTVDYGALSAATRVGKDAATGFSMGFSDGAAGAQFAAENLANGAIKGVAKKLEVHSPSRVMMRLGVYTAEGFEEGLERGDAERSMRDLVSLPSEAANDGGGAARRWGASASITVGDVIVYGSDETTARRVGREVRASVHAELASLLEELDLSA